MSDYFNILRSMDPSPRLLEAIDKAEEDIRADERERVAKRILNRNLWTHGEGCLCVACGAVEEAAEIAREDTCLSRSR